MDTPNGCLLPHLEIKNTELPYLYGPDLANLGSGNQMASITIESVQIKKCQLKDHLRAILVMDNGIECLLVT